mmetsp:Transcript_3081/g.7936  ORF Transcript_3081/g.7936 Transcript_3081/m.7936 type:complete len:205 (-) Transcript_3081:16-630(-)
MSPSAALRLPVPGSVSMSLRGRPALVSHASQGRSRGRCRTSRRGFTTKAEAHPSFVAPDDAMMLLKTKSFKFVDLRPSDEYDSEHITKPPRCSVNVPPGKPGDPISRLAACGVAVNNNALLVSQDGVVAKNVADAIAAQWTGELAVLEGGYAAWREVWTTAGRRVPPKGRWMPTGTEALKSGLNVGDAAMSYEEQQNVEDATKY